jgi:hypothetical protein
MNNSLSSTKTKSGSGLSQKENAYEAEIEITKKLRGIRVLIVTTAKQQQEIITS